MLIWLASTFGVAFAVVEWREDPEPDFFCREAFRAFVNDPVDPKLDIFLTNCEDQLPGSN